MAMSKQEFIEMANFISKIPNNIGKEWAFKLAVHMGEKFNPNFDYNKFSAACGSAARNETLKEAYNDQARARSIGKSARLLQQHAVNISDKMDIDEMTPDDVDDAFKEVSKATGIIKQINGELSKLDGEIYYKVDEGSREGLRAGGIKLISLTPLREEK